MGSREHLCVHEEVATSRGSSKDIKCGQLTRGHKCEYYENFLGIVTCNIDHWVAARSDGGTKFEEFMENVNDIEDLLLEGRSSKICPFYTARHLQTRAEIIFMPYNYLIDPVLRKKVNVDIKDAILILDEAHNIEKWCCEAASFDLGMITLAQAIAELHYAIEILENSDKQIASLGLQNLQKDHMIKLLEQLLKLESLVNNVKISNNNEGVKQKGLITEFSF